MIAATPLLLTAEPGFSDIREIVPSPNYLPWAIAAGVACLLIGWFAWRRRRKGKTGAAPEPVEPPQVKARRLLEDLRQRMDPLSAEAFTVEVSSILRVYLEEAVDLPAPEQTSEEFLQSLRDQPWLTAELQRDLEEFMRLADLVKFARQSLGAGQRQRLLESAFQVIDTTEPKPEPETAAR